MASSRNWVFDVFPSFSGKDVRTRFLSHFLKELDRKLIITFKDNEIERSQSLDPELERAIRSSRIAVVVLSNNYASSSYCLNELMEIVRCKEELGQLMMIPIFYDLDPTHVRKQIGEFGRVFELTCQNKTEEVKQQWQRALVDVANTLGYHSKNWDNEATMIQEIAIDILSKLTTTKSKSFNAFVGIEDHISKVIQLLRLESKDVRKVGIWGPSGIGKTTVARTLYNRISQHFQGSVYIDRSFILKSREYYRGANPDDCNMKLYLQGSFLSKMLGKEDIKIDDFDKVGERLMHRRVLVVLDDLDDQMVLDTLVGQNQWFGPGSRIIAITKDKQVLRGHGITCIFEMGIPSQKLALEILCRSAFGQNSPPDGFMELSLEVASRAGGLPLGLNLLGSSLRGRDKKYWLDMIPSLGKGLDGKLEKALRVSYDELERKEYKAIFRHMACCFNGFEISDIKLMLTDSEMNVNIGLQILADKSLIRLIPSWNTHFLEMHCLVQEMGKEIVRAQSDDPEEREFLMDKNDVCQVLEESTGSKKLLGISLDIDEIDELHIHKEAFKGMRNLYFLNIYTKKWDQKKQVRWHLPPDFNCFPPKLRLLRLDGYPMRYMPASFRPESLVKLHMQQSKLEKLWEGVHSLAALKNIDLRRSKNLKEIPDLSMATNLETLNLGNCSSLKELPSSFQHLNKLENLDMSFCENIETFPSGVDLKCLDFFDLRGCKRLKTFPAISTNISLLILSDTAIEEFPSNLRLENLADLTMCSMKSDKLWEKAEPLTPLMSMVSSSLTMLYLSHIPNLVEFPSSLQNLNNLTDLSIKNCISLESFPTGINLEFLDILDLSGCSRFGSFPVISTNISELYLDGTAIEEVPCLIQNFSNLRLISMRECKKLKCVSLNISKLKHLEMVDFSDCESLIEARLNDCPATTEMETNSYSPNILLNFINCFNLDQEALLQQHTVFTELILSGEQVPSYFTHRTIGTSVTNIPLSHTSPSQAFFMFRVCAMFDFKSMRSSVSSIDIHLCFRFKGKLGNHFETAYQHPVFSAYQKGSHLIVFDCCFPPNNHLGEMIFDQVDVEIHVTSDNSVFNFKGWGTRLLEDYSSHENRFCSQNSETDEDNMVNDETEPGVEMECGAAEPERSGKRMRIT